MAENLDIAALRENIEHTYPNVQVGIRIDPIGDLVLDKIIVPDQQRSSGTGSAIMTLLADIADGHQIRMALTPTDDYGGSVTRLRKFYKRWGFVENSGRNKDFATKQTLLREPANR